MKKLKEDIALLLESLESAGFTGLAAFSALQSLILLWTRRDECNAIRVCTGFLTEQKWSLREKKRYVSINVGIRDCDWEVRDFLRSFRKKKSGRRLLSLM